MLKLTLTDGSYRYLAIHSIHDIRFDFNDQLVVRAERADKSGISEVAILNFEVLQPGVVYD